VKGLAKFEPHFFIQPVNTLTCQPYQPFQLYQLVNLLTFQLTCNHLTL